MKILSPMDLFRIAKKLELTPEEIIEKYGEAYIGPQLHIPVVRLKPRGKGKRCPLLKNCKCSVHDAKPAICALFPIGRAVEYPKEGMAEKEPIEKQKIKYFSVDLGCGDSSEVHTVREWLGNFGIPLNDELYIKWSLLQLQLYKKLSAAEKMNILRWQSHPIS